MKIILNTLSFLFLSATLLGQPAFTIEEAVAYAREHHAGLSNSRLEQQISAVEEERLESSWLPRVAASADVRYNPILQTTLLPAELSGGPGGELVEVQFGTSFSSALGLTVRQKVYDPVFQVERELKALGGKRAALDEDFENKRVGLRVRAAYFQALLNQEIFQNSQSLLASLEQLRQDVQVRVDNALESPNLLNTLNQQYRQQQSKIYVDSLNWQASLAGLKLEMHFPAMEEFHLADSLSLTMEDTLSLNTADNYDLQAYGFQLEESRKILDRFGRSKLPTVDAEGYLGAQFFSQSPDLYNLKRWYGLSYLGLTASLPLYDGRDRRYGVQIENLKMEQVRNQMQAYRVEQDNEALRASIQLESARAQARLAQQAIETAEKNLELERFNYQNEVTGFQPVFDALQALANSREQRISARAAYVQALLEALLLDL
ncbi:MAG: TolC family protein [Phaeodactylibacter sp.]|nr:TolC family protein [Phaeodactylibacter sp.]MCB9047983.1 TolC family protein [Lewinellaceae bacterium]